MTWNTKGKTEHVTDLQHKESSYFFNFNQCWKSEKGKKISEYIPQYVFKEV